MTKWQGVCEGLLEGLLGSWQDGDQDVGCGCPCNGWRWAGHDLLGA